MSARVGFTGALLAISSVLMVQSLLLSPNARLAPLWVVCPTLILLCVQLARDLRRTRPRRAPILLDFALRGRPDTSGAGPDGSGTPSSGTQPRRELRLIGWLAWLCSAVYMVGFLPAAVLFLLPFLRWEAKVGWGASSILTAVTLGLLFVAFGMVAGIPFPEGMLF